VRTEKESARQRVWQAGIITIVGLTVLVILSWQGTVYQGSTATRNALFISLAIPAVFYMRAIGSISHVSLRAIVCFAVVFGLIGLAAIPFDSTDAFYYIAQGWQQAQYDANPYSQVLRDVPNHAADPMIASPWTARNQNPWLDLPLPYGFLFATVLRIIASLGQGNWWLTLSLYGAFNAAAHAAIIWLIWRISHIMRLGDPKRAVFLYAWNPFVLAHSMGDLHNDALMGLLVVLAVYFVAIKRPAWVLAALAAAGMIKYIALALLPFAALAVYRLFGKKALAVSVAVSLLFTALLASPYLADLSLFKMTLIAGQMTESIGSLHSSVVGILRMLNVTEDRFPGFMPHFFAALKAALWLAFAVFAAHELRSALKTSLTLDRIIVRWTHILAFILFFSSSQFYAWYIGMLLPLAVLAYDSWVGRAVVAASVAHLLAFTRLRSKRIGYFIFCTVAPFLLTFIRARREKTGLTAPSQRRVPASPIALRS
jgi:hypothetical protein